MAIAALVLGIVSWMAGTTLLTSIPGVIVARMELKKIERGESSGEGKILAQIGFWASLANIIVFGGLFVLWCGFFGLGIVLSLFGAAASGGG